MVKVNGKSGLATKEDLLKVESTLKEKIAKIDTSMQWIKAMLIVMLTVMFSGFVSVFVKIAFF